MKNLVRETISFKRGGTSKKSLDLGPFRTEILRIKKYLNPYHTFFDPDMFKWISQCPPMAKELGVSKIEDIRDLVGFDLDTVVEDFDEDRDDLLKHSIPMGREMEFKMEDSQIFRWQMFGLPDGSQFIYYLVGLNDGVIARKEWIV